MKNYYSIDRLLKNVNVLQVGTGKNPTTPLYSETKKKLKFFEQKNIEITKIEHAGLLIQSMIILLVFQSIILYLEAVI